MGGRTNGFIDRFILEGMADNARQFNGSGVLYYPYVEPIRNAGKGLLIALAKRACVVITDDSPVFFLPRMVASASRKLGVLMEQIDSNGLLPMRAAERLFPTAHGFRRFLQSILPLNVLEAPKAEPLKGMKLMRLNTISEEIVKRWPMASSELLTGDPVSLASLPINHDVVTGGSGIFWVLGRYDRAWGPERPIFAKVRYMSSQNTARKVRVRDYINKYAP